MQSQSRRAAVIVAAIAAAIVSQTILASGGREGWTKADLASIAAMRWSQIGASPVDPSNRHALNADAALLGKRLFNDRGLSGNGQVACASCHVADAQFQDGRPTGRGVGIGRRRTMPVMGVAFAVSLLGRSQG
jgi:cytochrome c peroxidase